MGRIIRTISIKEEKPTPQEVELRELRAVMARWEMLNLGLDEHPARASVRLDTGKKIMALKQSLVATGLYKVLLV